MKRLTLAIMRYEYFWVLILAALTCVQQAKSAEIQRPREHLAGIAKVQSILVEAEITTNQGTIDTGPVIKIFTNRMGELGYTVVIQVTASYDVLVKVHCEDPTQREEKGSLLRLGKTLQDLNSFQGPPCFISYLFHGRPIPWQKVDRIIYSDGVKVAKQIASQYPDSSYMQSITFYLEHYEFPLLLTAEWGQIDRLIRTFNAPETTLDRKVKIISLLGEIQAQEAFPFLVETLKDESLVPAVARALGHFGGQARPYLISLLKTSESPDIQAAAAKGLGQVGAMTGDTSATPLLLEVLTTPGMDMTVQTEIVWSLGKAPDFGAHPILADLERKIWSVRSNDPQLQKLRQAVDWSIREVRQGGHTDEY